MNVLSSRVFDIRKRIRKLRTDLVRDITGYRSLTLAQCLEYTEGMISLQEAALLHELASKVVFGCIVEVGSYRGRSTIALARGSLDGREVPVYAIDPHEPFKGVLGGVFGPEDRGAFFRAMLETGCYSVVRLVNLSSEIVAPNWKIPVGLLWIDGDHTYEGVKKDFDCWAPKLTSDACVAFDDSLDTNIGPFRLINELLDTGRFTKSRTVGKVTVLAQRNNGRP